MSSFVRFRHFELTVRRWSTTIVAVLVGAEAAEEVGRATAGHVDGTLADGLVHRVDEGPLVFRAHVCSLLVEGLLSLLTHVTRPTADVARSEGVEPAVEVGGAAVLQDIVAVVGLLRVDVFVGHLAHPAPCEYLYWILNETATSRGAEVVAFMGRDEIVQIAITAVVLEGGTISRDDVEVVPEPEGTVAINKGHLVMDILEQWLPC